jgi:hypothetical protein
MRSLLAALIFLPLVPAQEVQGPVLGFAWDAASGHLRPILGIPGSSLLGAPLDLDMPLLLAEVSPRQDYALAAGPESVWLVRLEGNLDAKPVLGGSASRIAISPSGSAAVVYSQGLQILRGLPSTPSVASVALPGPLTAVAVNDAGDLVLAVSGEQLLALRPGVEPRFLGLAGAASALTFAESSSDALVADPVRNEVFLLRGEGERWILASERDGIADPVAVALTATRGFVANRGSSSVVVLDLAGGPPARVSCPCEITGLQRLRGEAVFRLTGPLQSASYLLEVTAGEPRLWFVPPGGAAALMRPPRERSR